MDAGEWNGLADKPNEVRCRETLDGPFAHPRLERATRTRGGNGVRFGRRALNASLGDAAERGNAQRLRARWVGVRRGLQERAEAEEDDVSEHDVPYRPAGWLDGGTMWFNRRYVTMFP